MDDAGTDEGLLREFVRGKREALGELARRCERALLGLASGLLDGRTDLACDAVQETWVRVIRFVAGFDGRSSFKTWVYRIAINQCRTVKGRMRDAGTVNGVGPASEHRPPEKPETGDANGASDEKAWLREQVRLLSPDKRTVLLLCYHEGMTHQQAAEILEVPLGTLKSRLHAALTTLRARMASETAT